MKLSVSQLLRVTYRYWKIVHDELEVRFVQILFVDFILFGAEEFGKRLRPDQHLKISIRLQSKQKANKKSSQTTKQGCLKVKSSK